MRKNEQISDKVINFLFIAGAVCVMIGALAWFRLKNTTGWIVAIGGIMMSLAFLISAFGHQAETIRARRLERMRLFSGLLFIVSGGFMIQGSGTWLPIFLIGSIFFIYSAFIKDNKPEK